MAVAKVGRPPTLSADTKDLLLEAIESGLPVRKACRSLGVETSTFYSTLSHDPEFVERYERAKLVAVDAIVHDAEDEAEKVLAAENGTQVAAAKVYIDNKWRMASRIAPQKWGDKASVHITGQISDDPQELAKRIAFLKALGGEDDEEAPEDASEA